MHRNQWLPLTSSAMSNRLQSVFQIQKSQLVMDLNASEKCNLFICVWINKLQPKGAVASAGQMGQHSPGGMIGLVHDSLTSSQSISSHRTAPLSHTQMRHGSGFHTSLSLYCWASWTQPPASSVVASRRRMSGEGQQWLVKQKDREMSSVWWVERGDHVGLGVESEKKGSKEESEEVGGVNGFTGGA